MCFDLVIKLLAISIHTHMHGLEVTHCCLSICLGLQLRIIESPRLVSSRPPYLSYFIQPLSNNRWMNNHELINPKKQSHRYSFIHRLPIVFSRCCLIACNGLETYVACSSTALKCSVSLTAVLCFILLLFTTWPCTCPEGPGSSASSGNESRAADMSVSWRTGVAVGAETGALMSSSSFPVFRSTCSFFTCRFRCPRDNTISFATLTSFRSGYGPVWMNYDASISRIAICIVPVGSRCRFDGTLGIVFPMYQIIRISPNDDCRKWRARTNCEICGLLSCHPLMPPVGPYVQLSLV